MRALRFIQLFRMIFGPVDKLDPKKIESMGLLAVKIAQMYAIRADLLGPEKCAELSRLLQRTGPLSTAEFEQRWPVKYTFTTRTIHTASLA